MTSLEEINGQQTAINQILSQHSFRRKKVFCVVAPPGAGTTWVLDRCAERWEANGSAALSAKGEIFARDRRLFPWLTMIVPRTKSLARLEVLKQGIAQGSRAVPVVGAVTSYLVDEVLNHTKHRLARQALFLTEPEQDLLYIIESTADSKPLMLTLDHPELWDEASWSLLALILSSKLDELYPSLQSAVVVIGTPHLIPSRLHALLPDSNVTELGLRALDLGEMPVALRTFDFPSLSESDTHRLYGVTNGRLDLLQDISHHFHSHDLAGFSTGWDDFYSSIVKRRLQALSERIEGIETLLNAAAIIGRTFTTKDIACLTGSAADAIHAAVRTAEKEHLLVATGELVQFESAELHRFFHREGVSEHARYHAKFAECLRLMRPGDYEYRQSHLYLAGQVEEALTCYALSALSSRREYRPSPDPGHLVSSSGWADIRRYLDQMLTAFDAYDDQRVREGLELLERVETFLPQVLIAERDYLEASLLLITPSVANYFRARSLIEKWKAIAATEAEVWARMAQTLFVALSETGAVDEARQLEAQLTAAYWERRNVDPWALHGLNVLRRRSECLHALPTATQRLEAALEYFGGSKDLPTPRNPIQYYYTLTNLIGNKLASGQFGDAAAKALDLEQLIHRYPSITWPTPEVAANNSILAQYLAGALNATSTAALFEKVFRESVESGDRLLLQNNYAVALILADRIEDAQELLSRGYDSIVSGDEPDGYHRYFLGNNRAVLSAMRGDITAARDLMRECSGLLNQFYPAIKATMTRRHELLSEVINEAARRTPGAVDRLLLEKYPQQLGPQWAFYGRGFLLTDIQFWSGD
jgi:hypothetical protein